VDFKGFIKASFLVDLENINGEFTWPNRCSGFQQVAYFLNIFLVLENLMMEGHCMESRIITVNDTDLWPMQL
jgi:hypothetical protein